MKHRLLVLNLALACAVTYAGFLWRAQWREAKAREAAIRSRRVPTAPPPAVTPLPTPPPMLASGYADIAQKMLFDKSRNPEVVIEPPPPPPPPPPMPPLPVFHGVMKLPGEPATVFLSQAGGTHQAMHPGDSIGQFKLVDVSNQEVVLEWQGKTIHKLMDEMGDRTRTQAEAGPVERTVQPSAPPPPVVESVKGPGEITNFGFKVCQPNDSTPAGTVVDGFRKTISQTAFGKACRWDPIGR
jgi:hypothetical protein